VDPIVAELAAENSPPRGRDFPHKIMKRLHVTPEPNLNAQTAALYYSRDLDFWGVSLQRANQLAPAGPAFESALRLNPESTAAIINLDFNHALRAGQQVPVDLSKTTPDHLGRYRSWTGMVTDGGPIDEPSFCYLAGNIYLQSAFLNQAIDSFARVRELEPDFLPARLSSAEVSVLAHRPDLAIAALEDPLANPSRFSLDPANATELNVVAAAAFIQNTNLARGVGILEKEISYHPNDLNLLKAATQVYFNQGLYTNALRVIKLRLATTPDDPTWLYGLGYAYLLLDEPSQAIPPLSRVIALDPDNHEAVFKRALAYLNTGKLNAARSDYQSLQQTHPKAYPVAYGLGEIAWRQHATNEAVQNYTLYLANAPTNSAEFKLVSQRLADLKGAAR
jgi:tetratricopeptide (TPR) repeat protein